MFTVSIALFFYYTSYKLICKYFKYILSFQPDCAVIKLTKQAKVFDEMYTNGAYFVAYFYFRVIFSINYTNILHYIGIRKPPIYVVLT